MKFTACTDVGKVRKGNEDAFLATDHLFAVADGMGGHMAGEVASFLALQMLQKEITAMQKEKGDPDLVKAAESANEMVFKSSLAFPDRQGMGTTLTAMLRTGKKLNFVHVGDSRAYLLREGNLTQLTEDHSVVAEMVRKGKLRPEEAETHPARSILTRALGTERGVKIDHFEKEARKGDKILLCTDGLNSMVREDEIREALVQTLPLEGICKQLVAKANTNGGHDNITMVLVEF